MSHAAPSRTVERQRLALAERELGEARAILNRLENLHRPYAIYDECDHASGEHPEGAEVVDCHDFETCLPPQYFICAHCCRDNEGMQLEECAADHVHDGPICRTAHIMGGGS